ncbi:alpha/beta hydrolase [Microscilla marina]|uniref:Lysophospholipase n=1 Tax=Microscilla marina ATCC 23134 TaxID=313606 RepID=A1ZR19_MICM2|nr:alpha/beta hydrolase [Microscilla marina]EAY27108.1 lysophospholipase [Microscilla marina ATCC 23134]
MEIQHFSWNLDKTTIKGNVWTTDNPPKGVVALVHGFGEHIDRYQHVAEYFNTRDIALIGYDQRGHGKTNGKRGHVHPYEHLLNDVDRLLQETKNRFPGVPIILYGHSWGGNTVSNYILKKEVLPLVGVVLSSPWLRLAFEPPKLQVLLGKLVGKFLPGMTQPNNLDSAELSNDQEVGKAYDTDPLVHGQVSVATFFGAHNGGNWALENASKLTVDTLIMHGTADKITSHEASKEFAQKAGDKATLQLWEGLRHETHNEIKKDEVLKFVADWIVTKLA